MRKAALILVAGLGGLVLLGGAAVVIASIVLQNGAMIGGVSQTCPDPEEWCVTRFQHRPEIAVLLPARPFPMESDSLESFGVELTDGADRGVYEIGWMRADGLGDLQALQYEPAFHIIEEELGHERLRVADAHDVRLAQLPGREYFVRNDEIHGKARVFINGERIYFLYGETARDVPLDHVERFLDSFHLE